VSFLLNTNVISEWVKARPDSGVITWLAEADEDRVFLSVVTLAELRYGITPDTHLHSGIS
jgi:toxin FitB